MIYYLSKLVDNFIIFSLLKKKLSYLQLRITQNVTENEKNVFFLLENNILSIITYFAANNTQKKKGSIFFNLFLRIIFLFCIPFPFLRPICLLLCKINPILFRASIYIFIIKVVKILGAIIISLLCCDFIVNGPNSIALGYLGIIIDIIIDQKPVIIEETFSEYSSKQVIMDKETVTKLSDHMATIDKDHIKRNLGLFLVLLTFSSLDLIYTGSALNTSTILTF
jgi:hypothetical protein